MLILFGNVLYYCKAFKDEVYKWLLLDVNKKTQDFGGVKNAKKKKKNLENKFPAWFGYKTVDPICYYKDFVIY